MRSLVLFALLCAACSKKDGAAGAAGSDSAPVFGATPFVAGSDACGKAIDHVVKLQSDMMAGFPDEEAAKVTLVMNKVGAAMAASCRETKWSTEATDCLVAIKNVQEAEQCDGKLTPAQKTASDEASAAAVDEAERLHPSAPAAGSASPSNQGTGSQAHPG